MTRWLLVFCDPPPWRGVDGWLERLACFVMARLRPGFRHVFAVRESEAFDGFVVVNPHFGNLDLMEVPRAAVFQWEGAELLGAEWFDSLFTMEEMGIVHLVVAEGHSRSKLLPRGMLTCISVVAHLIGWNKSSTLLTPWRLYRAINGQGDGSMGGFFGGGDKPDTSAADKARADAEREKEELKLKNKAKLDSMRARQGSGRGSLLDWSGSDAPGDKVGV